MAIKIMRLIIMILKYLETTTYDGRIITRSFLALEKSSSKILEMACSFIPK